MRLWSAFRCLLLVLAIMGIVSGPFTTPMSGPAMAAATTSAMADDMSCCPHEKPAIPDCDMTCPLMTVCAGKCFPSTPILSVSVFALRAHGDTIRTGNDVFGNPLAGAPLDRPPRT